MIAFLRRLGARGAARRSAAPPRAPRHRPLIAVVALVATVALLGACTEDLDTKAACPSLCPNQDVTLRDTILDAVALDTTLPNYPGKGGEAYLLVASQGTLDTRAVVRFDSVLRTFSRSATDTGIVITSLTTSRIRFSVDTTHSVVTAPFTVSVYDVDTPDVDPTDAAVLAAFDANRLFGSVTYASKAAVLGDTISIPLDPAKVLAKVSGGQRIRLGVRVSSASPVRLRLQATASGASGLAPALYYDPTDSTDAVTPLLIGTGSFAPAASPSLEFNARDYTIAASGGAGPLAADELAVGAVPGRRVYMRFAIPPSILDSSTIVRAQLLLTQRPAPSGGSSSVSLVPMLGLAGPNVTDPGRAALIAIGPEVTSLGLAALPLDPTTSGVRTLELGNVVRGWRGAIYDRTPRALVLRVGDEGFEPGELRFYSSEAADPNLRPRLSITYVPQVTFGLP